MSQLRRDRQAETAIKKAVKKIFGKAIDKIVVGTTEYQNGEPALFATIYMKAAQEHMSSSQLLDTISAAATALREIEDFRFPYVTFLAPEDEPTEGARPAA